MKAVYFFFFLLSCTFSLVAQEAMQRAEARFSPADGAAWTSAVREIPIEAEPFLSYFLIYTGQADHWQVRFSADGQSWTDWEDLHRDIHNPDKQISELGITAMEQRYYQLRAERPRAVTAELHFFSPGRTPEATTATPPDLITSRSCPCPPPNIVSRSAWCPDGSCPPSNNPPTQVTHLIVHHSAGTNVSNDWAAVVRAVWNLHVNGNGWSDVGYNWLIDPNGNVYEGRGNNVLGAHFCGTNSSTAGFCVLGDFTNEVPTAAAVNALVDMLAWKSCDVGIPAVGTSFHEASRLWLHRISGHRDGCPTQCPGNLFYPMLPEVREAVFNKIVAGCSGLAGPTILTATYINPTTYELSWIDNSEEEAGYYLERTSGAGTEFTRLAKLPANTTTYEDAGLVLNENYRYRVQAYGTGTTSDYSNEILVSTIYTGLTDQLDGSTLQLSPNPGRDQLRLSLTDPATGSLEVQLLDLHGRVLQRFSANKTGASWSMELSTESLPAGLYFVRLQLGERSGAWKWVKE